MSSANKTLKIYGIAGTLLTLAIPYFIMLHNDGASLETAQSLCPFKMLTGFPWPGCGITKSLIFLYEGDFSKSIYYHLFGPVAFLFCLITIAVLTIELITQREYFQKLIYNKRVAYFLGTTLALYHLTRVIYFVSTNSAEDILQQSIWK